MNRETNYPSIDKTHLNNTKFFERNPIIPNANIYTIIKLLSTKNLDNTAIDCHDLNVTYRKMLNDVVEISKALKELGAKKGTIISICMPNFYQAWISFMACNRIGAVATFLDNKASKNEICYYLNKFESPIFINYNESLENNDFIKKNSKVKYIITLNRENINSLDLSKNSIIFDDYIDFNSLEIIGKYQKGKIESWHFAKENALILFTSGSSTGKSKDVLLTNENVLAAEIYAKNTSHTENIKGGKTLICVPFSYPYGLITSALTSILWGKEAILAPYIGKNTISYYYSKKPNIVFGSPALLDLTMQNIPDNQDLSSVTHFISGGDFLTSFNAKRGYEFLKKHNAYNVEIGNGFGNAETVSIGSTPIGVPLRQNTAGKILVGSTAIIVDSETLEEKQYNQEGLLCISGKHVYKEYYKNPDLTKETKFIKNGKEFFKTGTLGFIDKEGYFTPTGRESRFYIMSSLDKVYCDKVQNIICNFKYVKDCAVVKVCDDKLLYVNKAYIVLNDGYDDSKEMKDKIINLFHMPVLCENNEERQLRDYEIPTYIEFVEKLPRKEGMNKIDYQYLEEDAMKELDNNHKCKILKK